MPKLMSPQWGICLFSAILIASLIAKATPVDEAKGNVLAMTHESIGKQIDEFVEKLKELKQNPPKIVEGKYTIVFKEKRVTLEYLEKILAFLELLNELTEKMMPYRQHYPSLATFDDQFHKDCAHCIHQIDIMQMMDIKPDDATLYDNVLNFLKQRLLFKGVKGNGVIDTAMKTLRDKIKEYLASLQLEKLILNYQVHILKKMEKVFDNFSKQYKTKYIPEIHEIANNFVSSLTTEQRQIFQQKAEKREKKMAAGKLSQMEKQNIREELAYLEEIFYQKEGNFGRNYYTSQREHELMVGATGQLATFLVEIIRNILAGTRQNPKSLETTWILAQHIVIPAFDKYAKMSKNTFAPKVTTYLKEKCLLPKKWIESESRIIDDGKDSFVAQLQAQIRYYTGSVLLAYVKLTKSIKVLFGVEQDYRSKEKEKVEELTKTFSHLPINFGALLEQLYMGTLKSNMIEVGKNYGNKKPTGNDDGKHLGSSNLLYGQKSYGLNADHQDANSSIQWAKVGKPFDGYGYRYLANMQNSSVQFAKVGKPFAEYQYHLAKEILAANSELKKDKPIKEIKKTGKPVDEIGASDNEKHKSNEEFGKSDKAKRVQHKPFELIVTSTKTDEPAREEIGMSKKTVKPVEEIGTTGKKHESVVNIDTAGKTHGGLLYQPYHHNLFGF